MKQINVAVIGTGWCGGIRAETAHRNPLVKNLYIAETNEIRLKEMTDKVKPVVATTDYRELLKIAEIDAVMISATPETTHFPIAKESLLAGKHVFLEKPIAIALEEADELIAIAKQKNLKFTIGYSQRFNPKYAYVKKSINDGADTPFDEAVKVDQMMRRPLESTEDYSEGLLAHFEKRRAIFKGK
jgi:scyllo-inositol 2-dehydrogenase (NAD+)